MISLLNSHWPDAIGQSISYRASEQGPTTGPTGMWKFCGHSIMSIIWASKTWFGPVNQCLPLAQMASELNSFWHSDDNNNDGGGSDHGQIYFFINQSPKL